MTPMMAAMCVGARTAGCGLTPSAQSEIALIAASLAPLLPRPMDATPVSVLTVLDAQTLFALSAVALIHVMGRGAVMIANPRERQTAERMCRMGSCQSALRFTSVMSVESALTLKFRTSIAMIGALRFSAASLA